MTCKYSKNVYIDDINVSGSTKKEKHETDIHGFLKVVLLMLHRFSRFSHSVVSSSLQPHGLQHTRPPCPWPSLGACSNSYPSSWWCHQLHPLLFLPSIFPSIRVFSNESALCIRWPKYWSFSFSISPSNEHSALISFRMDWFDLLAVQGTLKSLL